MSIELSEKYHANYHAKYRHILTQWKDKSTFEGEAGKAVDRGIIWLRKKRRNFDK